MFRDVGMINGLESVSKCKGCPYPVVKKGDRKIHIECVYPVSGKQCPLIDRTDYGAEDGKE